MRNIGPKETGVGGGGQEPWSDGVGLRKPAADPEQGDVEPPGGGRAGHLDEGQEAGAGVQLPACACHRQRCDGRAREGCSRTGWQRAKVGLENLFRRSFIFSRWYLLVIVLLYIGLITSFCLNVTLLVRREPERVVRLEEMARTGTGEHYLLCLANGIAQSLASFCWVVR